MCSESHFTYGACEPQEYVDYILHVDQEIPKNMMIEVEDLEEALDTRSLSLYLYNGSIPTVRRSKPTLT